MPIYSTKGIEAELLGFESLLKLNISNFSSEISLGYVVGRNLTSKSNLPSIPPFKANAIFSYIVNDFSLGLKSEIALSQNKIDFFEESTLGYYIFGLFFNFNFNFNNCYNILSINIDNLTNATYKNHLSRIKSIMPEPARSLRITYKLYY